MGLALDIVDVTLLATAASAALGYLYLKNRNDVSPKAPEKLSALKQSAGFGSSELISYLEGLGHENLVVLFYGSQTGTAEDLCIRTQNDISSKLNIPTVVLDPEEYDLQEISNIKDDSSRNWVCGFFMATYGEGEPTDNASEFYSWLMNGEGLMDNKGDQEDEMVEDKILEGLNYFVFGLGNKTYEYYNAIGRRLNNRLKQLGGNEIIKYGEGDDDESLEGDYLKWAPTVIHELGKHFGVEEAKSSLSEPHTPIFEIEYYDEKPDSRRVSTNKGPKTLGKLVSSKAMFHNSTDKFVFDNDIKIINNSDKAKVDGNTISIPRQCYHMEIDISNSGLSYKTGDHLGVYPSNNSGSVKKLAKFLNIKDLNSFIDLKPNPKHRLYETSKPHFDVPATIEDILSHSADIDAVLKQHHFEILAKYSENQSDQKTLFELFENRDKYLENVEKGQKTLACILEEFNSIKLPLAVALTELLRPIAIRYYSISSSSLENPNIISITAIVVRYAIEQQKLLNSNMKKAVLKQGLATSWLESLHYQIQNKPEIAAFCPLNVRTSTFKLPNNSATPIIMVGPGTGVAPFRGFIRERYEQACQGQKVGTTILFFGCRNESSDYLYCDEFASISNAINENGLSLDLRVITAFSRDSAEKVYVQHRVKEHASLIWEIINEQNGYFYICGDAKHMAADVNKALEDLCVSEGKLGINRGKAFIKDLKTAGRYHEDVW